MALLHTSRLCTVLASINGFRGFGIITIITYLLELLSLHCCVHHVALALLLAVATIFNPKALLLFGSLLDALPC